MVNARLKKRQKNYRNGSMMNKRRTQQALSRDASLKTPAKPLLTILLRLWALASREASLKKHVNTARIVFADPPRTFSVEPPTQTK